MFKHLNTYTDRHGLPRVYFRHRGYQIPLPAEIGTAAFIRAYDLALEQAALPPPERKKPRKRPAAPKRRPATNPTTPRVGVYLLLRGGYLAYIGSSINMPSRVATHRINGRPFDQAFYIGTRPEDRIALERALIDALKPPQNRAGLK
jgi:hypothetical protein